MFGGNWKDPILVKFRPIINQILEVSEVNQKIDIKMWFLHEWFDERLIWDPREYGNITVLHIPADKVSFFRIYDTTELRQCPFSCGFPTSPFIIMLTVILSFLKWFESKSTIMVQ